MTIVRFLALIEVQLEDWDGDRPVTNPAAAAQEVLDAFRESVNPSGEYGITFARLSREDVHLEFPCGQDVVVAREPQEQENAQ